MSHVSKKEGSILRNMLKEGLILWVHGKTSSILWVIVQKEFNSFGHVQKKGSIHWVIKKKKVQFCESFFQKRVQFFWVILRKFQVFESYSFFESFWKIQFFESYFAKGSILWVIFQKEFNSVSHIRKNRFNLLSHIRKKSSILWVLFKKVLLFEPIFLLMVQFSETHFKKNSILWLIFQKEFNSLRHISKRIRLFVSCCKEGFNFIESRWKEGFNSVILKEKKVQFFASYCKKGFNSLSHTEKRFNSEAHIEKRRFNS